MKKHLPIVLALLLSGFQTQAQTNVRAWYAQGQVWVVWEVQTPVPQTYAIYKKNTAFTNTGEANLIGRTFSYEFVPGSFIQQTGDPDFTYKIPKPDGTTYQLAKGEALFVETVTASGSAFYAVTEWGKMTVTPGQNITADAIPYTYDSNRQPVNCHLQYTEVLNTGHKTYWFSLWALGRQDENAGRPDFPVMANAAKNGMPSMFIVSESLSLDTSNGKKVPMTHWFHGGGGVAKQSIANRFTQFDIEPKKGISVAHNDDFPILTITEDNDTVFTSGRSLWFGWTKRHDPFDFNFGATAGDTVINYTQRRIVWINDWLIKRFPIDPNRVALQGYSMGSGGATVLAKSFPEKFSTACLFNCGLRGAIDPTSVRIVGSITDNLPTNLRGINGETMHMNEVFDLSSRLSAMRDFPLVRLWVGKNDDNERMFWAPDLVGQLRKADSLGWGTQIHWDERFHTYSTLGIHWIVSTPADKQTYRDNLSYQEFFRSNQSFPAFFNHRMDKNNNSPGIGKIGINLGDGDNWGTWGGYHNWNLTDIEDTPTDWATTAWLEANALFVNDNCPVDSLIADLAIRRPQQFKPIANTPIFWLVRDIGTNAVLQSGSTTVHPDDLVVIPQVRVFKENIRKVRIEISTRPVRTTNIGTDLFQMSIAPNPSGEEAVLTVVSNKVAVGEFRVIHSTGIFATFQEHISRGENRFQLLDFQNFPKGFYWIELRSGEHRQVIKWVKI